MTDTASPTNGATESPSVNILAQYIKGPFL